jgi:hypothetical protein
MARVEVGEVWEFSPTRGVPRVVVVERVTDAGSAVVSRCQATGALVVAAHTEILDENSAAWRRVQA